MRQTPASAGVFFFVNAVREPDSSDSDSIRQIARPAFGFDHL
jgi:hypothetical protein